LNSYIGIDEPFQSGVAIPVAFFDPFFSSSYAAYTAFGIFHLVIAALVAPGYFILSANHSVDWIKETLLEAILTFHQPDFIAFIYLTIIFSDIGVDCDLLTRPTLEGMSIILHR
jgi:hypothetical protein